MKDEFFKAGRTIVNEGDPCTSIMFITEGKVELCVKMKAKDRFEVFDTLKQGSFIGQMWALMK